MGNKKILILGAKGFPGTHCYDWNDDEVPNINIPDYDMAVINVVSLKDKDLERETQIKIRTGLRKILDTQGILVAIGGPEHKVITNYYHAGKREEIQSNYLWCPIPLNIKNEAGTSFEFKDDVFKEYFKNVNKWSYCFDIPKQIEKNVPLSIESHVTNRYGKYLAGIIFFFVPEVGWKSGDFIFLPCPTSITDIQAINFILEKFFKFYQKTPPPEWSHSIEVPGLSKVQKNIEANIHKIKLISEENDKFRKKESELTSYKELLYETGIALEEIVKKVFTELGYKPKPPIHKEEYVVEYEKKAGIVECKGNEKSIKRNDFRQLLEYTKEYELDGKIEHKGILIGNAWRLKPLEERNKSGTPIFPKGQDGVIDVATRHDIALLSTIDLFKAFCNFLEGKISAEDVMKKIFTSKGVVYFNK